MRRKKHHAFMAFATLLVFVGAALCGCSTAQGSGYRPSASGNGGSSGASSSDSTQSSQTIDITDHGVETIAAIADLKAAVEETGSEKRCVVSTKDGHNPYDVVWDYGTVYNSFVEAVDDAGMWEVLFDAAFYKANYPMLALQYHDDDALLLEHFQTVGVHEGRQGSEAFNVAAYMENCSGELLDAFGEHYECYYFYWALNQDTESEVDTNSDGHPLQMCIKLTYLQAHEPEEVNKYREEVDAAPVMAHPEFMAFACYRAWCDYTGTYVRHEWFRAHQDQMLDILDVTGANTLAENTVYGTTTGAGPGVHVYYACYRDSQEHYETMVSTKYRWFGCSNTYWGDDGYGTDSFKYCAYDLYMDTMDTYEIGAQ